MKLPADLLECGQSLVEVIAGVGSRDLTPNSSLPLRYDGIAKAGDEHALAEKQIAHPNCCRGFSQDHRNDRSFPRKWLEAQPKQLLAKVARVRLEYRNSLRMGFEELDTSQ